MSTLPQINDPNRNLMVNQIKDIIREKKTNICVSMDYIKCFDIINSIKILKDNIVMVKLHCDIIDDFSENFIRELVEICETNKIFIFEDRKFGDIGSTFKKQFMGGIYKIQSWCHITNFHSLVGEGIVTEFSKCRSSNQGGLLIAQMSNDGNLLDNEYMKKTIEIAERNRNDIIGFICQHKIADSDFLYMIPGINLESKTDNSDQHYITPQEAMERGADIMIIGRGIIGKANILEECKKYQHIGLNNF
jgi:orotidine-5'-phosphate decarboxylase